MTRTLKLDLLAIVGAALLAAGLGLATPASAQSDDRGTDTRLDALLRPHFDDLFWRKHYGEPGRPPQGRRDPRGSRPPQFNSLTVNCEAGDSVDEALYYLADHGILYLRAAGACKEPIYIDHPATIIGQPASPFDGAGGHEAVLASTPGRPCIQVARGVKDVVIRDLVLDGTLSGRRACLEMGEGAEVYFTGVKLHYAGQSSAIRADTGKLLIDRSTIESTGYDPAIVADGTRVAILRTTIRTGSVGLLLTPGPEGQADLSYVTLEAATGANDPTNFADTGIIARGAGSPGGRILVEHSDIAGYRTGIRIERGLKADIGFTRIRHAREGVVSEAEELTLTNSALSAVRVGVSVVSGHAWIERNRILGFEGKPYEFDVGGEMITRYNWIDPKRGCKGWEGVHPWCGPTPDIVMLADPSQSTYRPGWDGADFVIPAGERIEERPLHRSGIKLGIGFGIDLDGYARLH